MIKNTFIGALLLLCSVQFTTAQTKTNKIALAKNDVSIIGFDLPEFTLKSTQNNLGVIVQNNGSETVTSLKINWNDGTNHIARIQVILEPGEQKVVKHPTLLRYGNSLEQKLTISVISVNDMQDENPNDNTQETQIHYVTKLATKRVVFEKGTGTWCGACPAGDIGFKAMEDTYHDEFIGIAVHNGDPMGMSSYDVSMNLNGYPGCNVDRAPGNSFRDLLPSFNNLETAYNARKSLVVPAGLSLDITGTGTTANIKVTATFNTDISNANYRLGVIITEDKVSGTGSGWEQANYYSGTNDALGGYYQNLPHPVPANQMEYGHVSRALLGGYAGQANTVPTTITNGQVVTHTFNYTIPAGSTRANMHAVAVLVKQDTNKLIENGEHKSMDEALSVNEEPTINNLRVFPNPANDAFNMIFEAKKGNYSVTLVDMTGKEVYNKSYSNLFGMQEITIPVAQLAGGNYIISIGDQKSTFSKLVVVK